MYYIHAIYHTYIHTAIRCLHGSIASRHFEWELNYATIQMASLSYIRCQASPELTNTA